MNGGTAMTVEEIGSNVAERLLQGAMNHQQFANYYDFLGLQGYKLCHECHFYEQNCGYRKFITYFIKHYDKLIPTFALGSFSSPSIVPDNWNEHKRNDMDINTRRNAVKTGLEKYIRWEEETQRYLEDMYVQALNVNEINLAMKIKQYIESVVDELEKGKTQHLLIKSTDYDLPTIVSEQGWLIKKYTKRLKKFKRKESDYDQPQRS